MERPFSCSRPAGFLLAAGLVGLAVILVAILVPRGGSPDDVAVHFSGPGDYPIVNSPSPERASTALRK